MWVVVHLCSGLALGALLHLPLAILLPAALLLHVVLDLVPHWDYTQCRRRRTWALCDVGGAAVLTVLLWGLLALPWTIVLTGWVSALPDLDVANEVLPISSHRRLFPSHWRSFPHGRCRAAYGIPLQLGIVGASVAAVILRG
jgi:hypothetical protein